MAQKKSVSHFAISQLPFAKLKIKSDNPNKYQKKITQAHQQHHKSKSSVESEYGTKKILTAIAETKQERFPDYPVFKGLQRPLEFFGLQERYIYWAAASAGGAVASFILGYSILDFVAELLLLVFAVAAGGVLIVMDCTARRATTA